MSAAPKYPTDPELKSGIRWSLLAHFVLTLTLFLKETYYQSQPLLMTPTLRVDLVALPDRLKNQVTYPGKNHSNLEIRKILKDAEKAAERIKLAAPIKNQTKELAQTDEMTNHPQPLHQSSHLKEKEKIENRNKNAVNRLKALAKIQSMENLSANPIKGNRISPGSSLSGEAKESAEASYLDILRERLQNNWALPTWVARQSLAAQVQVYINFKGKVKNFRFVKTSGNPQFDEAVKRAIEDSQPLPFPPEELAHTLVNDGILVGFPL